MTYIIAIVAAVGVVLLIGSIADSVLAHNRRKHKSIGAVVDPGVIAGEIYGYHGGRSEFVTADPISVGPRHIETRTTFYNLIFKTDAARAAWERDLCYFRK